VSSVNMVLRELPESRPSPRRMRWRAASLFLPAILLALIAVLAVIEPRFLSPLNVLNLSRNVSFLTIVSLGQMIVMIVGGMDLSIGVVVALSSVTTAIVMNQSMAWFPGQDVLAIWFALAAALGVSGIVGMLNGVCIAVTGASAFIVTLGTFSIVGGISYYITAGIPIYGMPNGFTTGFGRGSAAGLPYSVYIATALVILVILMQRQTKFGRYLYAIGGNPGAARLSGVPVRRYTVAAYICCSVLAGLAGFLITARVGGGQANLGSEYMLQSIAVAVVAGVSLRGGLGRGEMVLLSGIFITVFGNAMNLVRIDSKIQTIVFGVVLLIAVFLDQRKARRGRDV
jgi:ribose transport system permease protein